MWRKIRMAGLSAVDTLGDWLRVSNCPLCGASQLRKADEAMVGDACGWCGNPMRRG